MIQFSQNKLDLLKMMAEYGVLFTSQIATLRGTGLRATQKALKSLHSKKLIETRPHTLVALKGRPENVSSLSDKGAEYLKTKAIIDESITINSITGDGITHTDHELLINWFRVHLLQIDNHIEDLKTDFISANTPFLPYRKNGMPTIADVIQNNGKDEWFVPDGVFSIFSQKQGKRLLFFLEMDCATESIQSSKKEAATIARKVQNYQIYFQNEGYKRYEKKWVDNLNGFRLLFVTTSQERKMSIFRFLRAHPSLDFVWITDVEQVLLHGLGDKIWLRGGEIDSPLDSILGPTLARKLTLPKIY